MRDGRTTRGSSVESKLPLSKSMVELLQKDVSAFFTKWEEDKDGKANNIELALRWFHAFGVAEGQKKTDIVKIGPINYARRLGIYDRTRTKEEDLELVRVCRDTVLDILQGKGE